MRAKPVTTRKKPTTSRRGKPAPARPRDGKPARSARATAAPPARGSRKPAASPAPSQSPPAPPPEPAVLEPTVPSIVGADVTLPAPEPAFAARVQPEPSERPFPSTRRAIFFDVENSSRAEHIAKVIEHLAVDRLGNATELVAVGNWKVIGQDTARLLARHGGHLVHSAPSAGVRDWSDLRIAVTAGVWLAAARPGDIVEIVSDDQAFDAVGDVAASLGIAFRRLSYRVLADVPDDGGATTETASEPRGHRRGRRRGRRGRREGPPHRVAHAPVVAAPAVAAAESPGVEEAAPPHTAPHDEILAVARELMAASTGGGVSLDALANALKGRGFGRTPGSPRLITRLRRIKELELNRAGMITFVGAGGRGEVEEPAAPAAASGGDGNLGAAVSEAGTEQPPVAEEPPGAQAEATPGRPRRQWRGGRRRRGRPGRHAPAAAVS